MPVFEALYNKDLQFVKKFVEMGGSPDLTNETGSTLLHEAVHLGDLDLVKYLLAKGAKVNCLDSYGNTPMHVASIFGNQEVAKELLHYGADIDPTSEARSWTPLMLAINESYTEMAEWLITQGANMNHVDPEQGWTPLLVACEQGLKDISLRLIRKGVKVDAKLTGGDARGKYAIHLASYYGEVEIIRELLEQGMDINLMPEGGGLSALHWAVYNNHMDLMTFLLEQGADPNLPAGGFYNHRTPLHYAVSAIRYNMAELLLEYNGDPLQKDAEGRHPIDLILARINDQKTSAYSRMLALLESYI